MDRPINEEIQGLHRKVEAMGREIALVWRVLGQEPGAFRTALLSAVRQSDVFAVRQFIRHGADPGWTNDDGQTALHLSVFYENEDLINLLLSEGWPVDARDKKRQTPLHIAAAVGRQTAARLLLRWKARTDLPDENGHTPLHLAAMAGHLEQAQLLLAQPGRALIMEDAEGRTALHLAAGDAQTDMVRFLLESGANPNHRAKSGITALHEAARSLSRECINLLLEAGANPLAKDDLHRLAGDYVGLRPNPGSQLVEERREAIKNLLREAERKAGGETPAPSPL